jgi:hypothetical protein
MVQVRSLIATVNSYINDADCTDEKEKGGSTGTGIQKSETHCFLRCLVDRISFVGLFNY